MRCPKDHAHLEVHDHEGHTGYVCADCKGVWLPWRYVEALGLERSVSGSELFKAIKQNIDHKGERDCPDCEHLMSVSRFDEMDVDICTRCNGLWLDSGELAKLQKDVLTPDETLKRSLKDWANEAIGVVFAGVILKS